MLYGKMKKQKIEKDIGKAEDTIFLLKNMIAAENHSYACFINTKNEKYLEVLEFIREKRKQILNDATKKEKSQIYCLSKHLLAMAVGALEVGNRLKGEKAKEFYEMAGDFEALYLLLNGYIKENGM